MLSYFICDATPAKSSVNQKDQLQIKHDPVVASPKLNKADFPTAAKESEVGRINLAYAVVGKTKFSLVEDATYIWVYRESKNEGKEVIFGVENVTQVPHRAAIKAAENKTSSDKTVLNLLTELEKTTRDSIKKQVLAEMKVTTEANLKPEQQEALNGEIEKRQLKTNLGHATLSVSFDAKTGHVIPAKSLIGGELYYVNGEWVLNNRSGRLCHVQKDKNVILELMKEVSHTITQHLGITPKIEVLKDRFEPNAIWEKSFVKEAKLDSAERGIYVLMKMFKYTIPGARTAPGFQSMKKYLTQTNIREHLKLQKTTLIELSDVITFCSSKEFNAKLNKVFSEDLYSKITSLCPIFLLELTRQVEATHKLQA